MTIQSRFLAKCGEPDANGCIPWTANKLPHGYGLIRIQRNGKWVQGYAHRVAWSLARGEIPVGMNVLHHCDNPSCVNIDHLFLGNQKANMRDKASKGRHHMRVGGFVNGLNAVDDERIRDLRAAGCTRDAIADWLGISQATVSFVLSGARTHA